MTLYKTLIGIAKMLTFPFFYTLSFIVIEVSLIPLLPSTSETQTVVTTSSLTNAAIGLFVFILIISLITLKLSNRFHYLENSRFLVVWGVLSGLVSVFIIGAPYSAPIFKILYMLF
ncbi:hypothetical protein KKF55_01060 [Patescibacteria group bacterium]|nr:hypothetical protein [Patescibacteria group bacterium]